MSNKEARYKSEIVKRLKKEGVFAQGIGSAYSAGVPDQYVEARGAHMWIEYKWYDKFPKSIDLVKKNKLTALQNEWLIRAHNNKQLVAVIVASYEGAIALRNGTWVAPFMTQGISTWIKSPNAYLNNKNEVVEWILKQLKALPEA